jgi:hypothetical protein
MVFRYRQAVAFGRQAIAAAGISALACALDWSCL